MNQMEFVPGEVSQQVQTATDAANTADLVKRIWRKDATLWKEDEASQKIIKNSLGWLTVPDEMIGVADELREYGDIVRQHGFQKVMVCGMGGSSLCPEVLAQTFGQQPGYPELLVLDSTDPEVLAALLQQVDVARCLFIISSKSGSTTEPNTFYKFWYDQASKVVTTPGNNFVAITDPGSSLVDNAQKLGFQRTFLNQADIGGRYSALSYFGMLPAALMGLDIKGMLSLAKQAAQTSFPVMPVDKNIALQLGTIMGACANAGRDKLTLVIDPKIRALGLWIEQLVAESTGKEGKGIIPIASEDLGTVDVYGNDRLFVSISVGPTDPIVRQDLHDLSAAGHPVVFREMNDINELGAEFFTWEFATACAGWQLGINPFDQPNVQESKDATKDLLNTFEQHGSLAEQTKLVADDVITIYAEEGQEHLINSSTAAALKSHLDSIKPGDYVAFLDYIEETPMIESVLASIRLKVRDAKKCATTTGYGPRFLHSTGQLHKGGPGTGVFFQLTAIDKTDFAVPGEPYTFGILKQAQALGDFRSLVSHGRRAIRVELGKDVITGLTRLDLLIAAALSS
jgi:transaldolase/glucose-6-phosphate isomerase